MQAYVDSLSMQALQVLVSGFDVNFSSSFMKLSGRSVFGVTFSVFGETLSVLLWTTTP